jgi:hypothetical protein
MWRSFAKSLGFVAVLVCPQAALAVSSAELYTSESYGYGRMEARVQFAPGSGVVSSVFSWKDKSEQPGVFWNELDFEKLGGDCYMQTNPIYGNPAGNHEQKHTLTLDMCGALHTYAYEWTPEAIVWLIDGVEIRRETGDMAKAFVDNAPNGMQLHLNVWPGDVTFGGAFDPAILPVHQYVDWVQFYKYEGGEFTLAWREDFDGGALPQGWQTGTWGSPKNYSTHSAQNVSFMGGFAVLSLTADDAQGPGGAVLPMGSSGGSGAGGSGAGGSGTSGAAGSPSGGVPSSAGSGGAPSSAGVPTVAGTTSTTGGGASAGAPATSTDTGGCSVGVKASGSALGGLLGIAALGWLRRRRVTSSLASRRG